MKYIYALRLLKNNNFSNLKKITAKRTLHSYLVKKIIIIVPLIYTIYTMTGLNNRTSSFWKLKMLLS